MQDTMYNYDTDNILFTEYKNLKFLVGTNNKLSTENLIREINNSDFLKVITVQPSLNRIVVKYNVEEEHGQTLADGLMSGAIFYIDTTTNKVLPVVDISEYRYDRESKSYYKIYVGEIKVDLEEYARQVK